MSNAATISISFGNATRIIIAALIGTFAFLVYFNSVDIHSQNFYEHNFVFDTDIKRVVKVLTDPIYVHEIEAHRHPLFELLLKPLGQLSLIFFDDERKASLAVTALFGAIGVAFSFLIFEQVSRSKLDSLLFTAIFAASASTWLLFSIPESFSFNCAAIVVAFYLQTKSIGQNRGLIVSARHLIFCVVSAGITISNAGYAALSYANLIRKWKQSWKWVIGLTLLYIICVLLLLELLSRLQHIFYPNSWVFTGLLSFFDQLIGNDFHYIRNMNLRSVEGIVDVMRTFFVDSFIAPGVEPKTFVSFSDTWHNLVFVHRFSFRYVVTLIIFFTISLMSLIALWRERRFLDADLQLAFAFVALGCMMGFGFSTVGTPLIYAVHSVFPIIYIGIVGYSLVTWPGKRYLLVAFAFLLTLNNYDFMFDINRYLNEATGLGVEYPSD